VAVVTKEVLVQAGVERLFEVLVDYPRYPEFVPGIKACKVLDVRGEKHVEYELDLGLRRIRYVLRHEERRPTRVSWSLVSGDALKVSNGSWELTPEGNATRARYSVDIQVARLPLVPQALIDKMTDQLTRVQLPRTLEAFRARAEER
jgi:coenzyme Q-binding protein COQ10